MKYYNILLCLILLLVGCSNSDKLASVRNRWQVWIYQQGWRDRYQPTV